MSQQDSGLEVFHAYPSLAEHIPYMPLAQLPTMVQEDADFAERFGMNAFHIKRDDKSGVFYGGNKTRKLGFLLAAAAARNAHTMITFGAAGSNHALATAIYAKEMGMNAVLILGPQHNSHHVRENLCAMHASGATLSPCPWKESRATAVQAFHEVWKRDGAPPYVIPPGGSSPLGTLGFVNAVYELQEQVAAGILPEPDIVYVASGTMGTCVGLALGLCSLGMKTKVMAVRVTTPHYTSMERAEQLFTAADGMLCRADSRFPRCMLDEAFFEIRDEFFGQDYALHTPEGMAAVQTAKEQMDIRLEGTYTGKTFAGLLADAASGILRGKNVLFWNTYNGGAPKVMDEGFDYHQLPPMLQVYFESQTQELDVE